MFISSANYWDMKWYSTYEEAKEVYDKEKVEYFLVEKVLFHSNKRVIES